MFTMSETAKSSINVRNRAMTRSGLPDSRAVVGIESYTWCWTTSTSVVMQEAEVVRHATLERRVCLVSVFSNIGEHRQRNPHAGRIVSALTVDPAVGIELCLEQLGRLIRGEGEIV